MSDDGFSCETVVVKGLRGQAQEANGVYERVERLAHRRPVFRQRPSRRASPRGPAWLLYDKTAGAPAWIVEQPGAEGKAYAVAEDRTHWPHQVQPSVWEVWYSGDGSWGPDSGFQVERGRDKTAHAGHQAVARTPRYSEADHHAKRCLEMQVVTSGGWSCDGCGAKLTKGTTVPACHACDYCLCNRCGLRHAPRGGQNNGGTRQGEGPRRRGSLGLASLLASLGGVYTADNCRRALELSDGDLADAKTLLQQGALNPAGDGHRPRSPRGSRRGLQSSRAMNPHPQPQPQPAMEPEPETELEPQISPWGRTDLNMGVRPSADRRTQIETSTSSSMQPPASQVLSTSWIAASGFALEERLTATRVRVCMWQQLLGAMCRRLEELDGLRTEHIFRVPGHASDVSALLGDLTPATIASCTDVPTPLPLLIQ
eukprot:COSAG01_NODE_3713_length_5770_cov_71.034568_6_plen_427_part_00